MGESSHNSVSDTTTKSKSRLAWYAAGTAGVLIIGGILFQAWRANPGAAASDAGEGGTVRVSDPAGTSQSVARVGNYQISESQLVAELKERHGIDVLDKIINRTIIQQACQERNLEVTTLEVEREIQTIAKRFSLDPSNWYKMIQSERGLSPVQYRRDVIWPMLALRKLAGSSLKITEADIQKEWVRSYTPRAKVRMILLDNPRRANEVWEKVRSAPKDFERFVTEYSIDPNSRPVGGRIPPIPRYSGNPELEKAAFALKPGQISSVIQVQINRYMIMVGDGKTEQIVAKIDEVRDDIEKNLRESKERDAADKIFLQLQREIRVDNFLTNVSTGSRKTAGDREVSSSGRAKSATRTR